MFSKDKGEGASRGRKRVAPTIISGDMHIDGNIASEGEVQVVAHGRQDSVRRFAFPSSIRTAGEWNAIAARNNRIEYTLDPAGNRTFEKTYNNSGVLRRELERGNDVIAEPPHHRRGPRAGEDCERVRSSARDRKRRRHDPPFCRAG